MLFLFRIHWDKEFKRHEEDKSINCNVNELVGDIEKLYFLSMWFSVKDNEMGRMAFWR